RKHRSAQGPRGCGSAEKPRSLHRDRRQRAGGGVLCRRPRTRPRGCHGEGARCALRSGPARRGLAQGEARAYARPGGARRGMGPWAPARLAVEPASGRAQHLRGEAVRRSLDDWLRYIEAQHPAAIALGLDRVSEVLGRLSAALACPVITVGGTNGKGSTCAMLESTLRAAGYRTGLYTSPHLVRYNARVRVAGYE